MKKLLLFIVIFTILAVGCTAIMIKIENENQNVGNISYEEIKNEKEEIHDEIPEKTLNLNGTYSQNDLIISKSDFFIEEYEKTIKIPQISGLKNKTVENKINDNIKSKIKDKIRECVLEEDTIELLCQLDNFGISNFSNVISFSTQIYFNYSQWEEIYLNYNLVDGEELNFEDLFKKNEELKPILRKALYKNLVEKQNYESSSEGDYSFLTPYYDSNDKTWYAEKIWFDEDGIKQSEIIEYIPPMSEYEIEKKAEKFLKSTEKNFYFTPDRLSIILDDYMYSVYFKDIADKVVIYDKYLTKESLYENDNITSKSFIACSAESDLGKYKETRYESDNFFYDINIIDKTADGYPAPKFVASKMENQSKEIEKKIAEYKKTARDNPDKAYFVFIEARNYSESNSYAEYNPELGYFETISTISNLFTVDLETKLIVCDIEEKEYILEKILSVYRYYNLHMCGNIINNIYEGELVGGEILDLPVDCDVESKCYDVLTGKKITSNELEQYSKLKELKSEILPSTTRRIEKTELENMDKDELNRAYNEIFARHGHDFKNPEYEYYFNLWDWYEPISGKTVTVDELSEIEKYNFNLIKSIIDEKN